MTAFDLPAGSHCVTVTDAVGCDTTLCFLITEPSQLLATSTQIDVICHGLCSGSATALPTGGTPFVGGPSYNYSWNTIPVQTNATATGLCAGTYTCTITDSTGCIKYLVIQISEPDAITLTWSVTEVTCNGGNDGEITIIANGGTPNYSYLWNTIPAQTTETATGLGAGTWTVTITDANGCQMVQSISVFEPAPWNVSATACGNVSCYGLCDGKTLLLNLCRS